MSNNTTDPNEHDSEVIEYYGNPAIETIELYARVRQLRRALTDERRTYANLVAACRAGLLADRDGEADPWAYVRDELPKPPPGHPLHPDSGSGGGR